LLRAGKAPALAKTEKHDFRRALALTPRADLKIDFSSLEVTAIHDVFLKVEERGEKRGCGVAERPRNPFFLTPLILYESPTPALIVSSLPAYLERLTKPTRTAGD
jgi:hypothetical protein